MIQPSKQINDLVILVKGVFTGQDIETMGKAVADTLHEIQQEEIRRTKEEKALENAIALQSDPVHSRWGDWSLLN